MKINNKCEQQGFTLVEVLVALGIGLFLTAGAMQIFITTKGTNRTQENLSRMQENARFAMHFLTKDIREAGYAGGVCGGEISVIENAYNNLASSAAQYQFGSITAVAGTDNTGLNGSDSITVNRLASLGVGFPVLSQMPTTSANLKVPASSGLPQYGIAIVTDCSRSDIFEITNDPATGGAPTHDVVVHNSGAVTQGPGNKSQNLTTKYGTNAKVYFLAPGSSGSASLTYDIQNDGNGIPGLRRNTTQLIANIENIQILYGERLAGDNMYYVPAATAGLNMDNVVSVKVNLLVRSPDDNVATAPQAYTFDGSTATPTDRRLRKVYSSTIRIRNRIPNN